MADRWGKSRNSVRLYFFVLQNHCRWWLQPRNKKTLIPWKNSYDQPRQRIKRKRHYFVSKGPSSQGYDLSSGHVWMWVQFCSVQSLSHVRLFVTLMNCSMPGLPVHHQLPEFTQTHIHRVGDAIQTSHPLSFPSPPAPQSLLASGSFPMSQLFTWGSQSTGVSALASVLPKNTQDWSPLEWTGWISLQSKGLSRVFSNTTVQKHQFFGAQLSSQSNFHIHTWPLEKP